MSILIKEWGAGQMTRHWSTGPCRGFVPGVNFPWPSLRFDPDTDKHAYTFGVMPESDLYTASEGISAEFDWVSNESNVGVVRWQMNILGRKAVETLDVAFTQSRADDSARVASNTLHTLSLAISAPSLEPGDHFIMRIMRDANHANDNYKAFADLVRLRFYVT